MENLQKDKHKEADATAEIDIYFGSKNQTIGLCRVPSRTYSCKPGEIVSEVCQETINQALSTRFKIRFLGKDYENLLVPCVPAVDLRLPVQESQFQATNAAMVMVRPEDPQADRIGYQSGTRSAILPVEGGLFLRLKGCGMKETGFVGSACPEKQLAAI